MNHLLSVSIIVIHNANYRFHKISSFKDLSFLQIYKVIIWDIVISSPIQYLVFKKATFFIMAACLGFFLVVFK